MGFMHIPTHSHAPTPNDVHRVGITACILLLAIGASGIQAQDADAPDCTRTAATTPELAHCYHQQYKKADSVRTAVYNDVMTTLKEEERNAKGNFDEVTSRQIETLRAAKRAWTDYRGKHCQAVYATYGRGTGRGYA